MKKDLCIAEKAPITHRILSHLVEHPNAQDTLEGIVEWWLLEQEIKFQTEKVKEALGELVEKGLVLECKGNNSQTHYRINQSRDKEIKEFIKTMTNISSE